MKIGIGISIPTSAVNARLGFAPLQFKPISEWANGANGGATVEEATVDGPEGDSVTAYRLTDLSVTNVMGRLSTLSIQPVEATYSVRVFAHDGDTLAAEAASMRVVFTGGSQQTVELVIDPINGDAQWRGGLDGGASFAITPAENGWFLVEITATNTGSNTSLIVEIRPSFADEYGPKLNLAATGDALFYGPSGVRIS